LSSFFINAGSFMVNRLIGVATAPGVVTILVGELILFSAAALVGLVARPAPGAEAVSSRP